VRQRGVALVVVLWVLALMAVLAAGFSRGTRTQARLAFHQVAAAQAQALAEGGVERGVLELLRSEDQREWRADGTAYPFALAGGRVNIAIQDESGKVDLNTAADELLTNLFQVVGLDPDASAALTDAIGDWRDPDNERRLHGAEEADYRAAGLPYGPKNARFDSVDELREVLGVTPALFQRLRPYLTVYSEQRWINPLVASREVLLAVPGWNADIVDAYLEQRESAQLGAPAPAPPAPPPFAAAYGRGTYTIRATGISAQGARANVEATVRIVGAPQQPYTVLAWHDAAPPVPSPAAASTGS
jgi:general secretion pathway protein K